jgi:GNAT superfamily N-acetyltransferase
LHDGTLVCLALAGPGTPAAERAQIVARDGGGQVVGQVAYRRVYGPRADLWVDVHDAYWHRGLPGLLIGSLRERAAAAGISTFLLRVHVSDIRLLALLAGDFGARCTRDGAIVDVELACAAPSPPEAGRPALHVAGQVRAASPQPPSKPRS